MLKVLGCMLKMRGGMLRMLFITTPPLLPPSKTRFEKSPLGDCRILTF